MALAMDVEAGDEDVVELGQLSLFVRAAHGGDDVPALLLKELRGGFADAAAGTRNQNGFTSVNLRFTNVNLRFHSSIWMVMSYRLFESAQ